MPKRAAEVTLLRVSGPRLSPYPDGAVRRLFSTFAHGPPGLGLLLLRLAGGITLVLHGALALRAGPSLGAGLFAGFSGGLGILLIAGLWTPFIGALVGLDGLVIAFAHGPVWLWLIVAALGAGLALTGPGAWSIDARLFGWRRLDIRDQKERKPPPF